jgi:hypothetical protein
LKRGKAILPAHREEKLIGLVTSRKCPSCGHHEVGITSEDGTFHTLRPGALVQVLGHPPAKTTAAGIPHHPSQAPGSVLNEESLGRPWVPDPVKGHESLRLKYGVMVGPDLQPHAMNAEIFKKAYLEKLLRLLDKEAEVPVAVILDRFLTAAHLACDDPRKTALDMWEELDEIRRPVELVIAWLQEPGPGTEAGLFHPEPMSDTEKDLVSEDQIKRELTELSLEEFMALL